MKKTSIAKTLRLFATWACDLAELLDPQKNKFWDHQIAAAMDKSSVIRVTKKPEDLS